MGPFSEPCISKANVAMLNWPMLRPTWHMPQRATRIGATCLAKLISPVGGTLASGARAASWAEGLEDAVSFTKGCYLGQEVVERIRSRGHVNKRLCGLLLDGNSAASAGDVIASESKQVGAVTSSVFSPKLQRAIAMGYVNREFWEVGTPLSVRVGGATVRATVTGLPFLRHA